MTVSKDRLGDAIESFIDGLTDAQKEDLQYIWRGMADEILSEITTNAVVTTTIDSTDYTGSIS